MWQRALLVVSAVVLAGTACASSSGPEGSVDAPARAVEAAASEVELAQDAAADIYGDAELAALESAAAAVPMPSLGAERSADGMVPVSFSASDSGGGGVRSTVIRLKDGRRMIGRVTDNDGEAIEFAFTTESGGEGSTRLPYSQLHPRTAAEMMSARTAEDDAAGHLAIGDYAARNGLYEIARVHYLHVGSIDAALGATADERLMDVITRASQAELARGNAALDAGKSREGERTLARLQREFPGTGAAEQAANVLAARAAGREALVRDTELARRLNPATTLFAQAEEHTVKGLAASATTSQATREFKLARERVLSAERQLERLDRAAQSDEALAAAMADVATRLSSHFVDNQIHLAGMYMTRGNYDAAMRAVNEALARDPRNREALALRSRIQTAAAEDRNDEWWRRHRRGSGFYPFGWRRYGHQGWRGTSLGRVVSPTGAGSGNMRGGKGR